MDVVSHSSGTTDKSRCSGRRLSLTKVGDLRRGIRRATFLADGKRVLVSIGGDGSKAALVDVDHGTVVRRFE
jgi:hypothetical protein